MLKMASTINNQRVHDGREDLSPDTIIRHQRLVKAIFPEIAALASIEKNYEDIRAYRVMNKMV
jgi:hypothetical protein